MTRKEKLSPKSFLLALLLSCVALSLATPSYAADKKQHIPNLTALDQAAHNGDSQAQYSLGSLYCLGAKFSNNTSVPKDVVRCLDLLTRSASQGNVDAQTTLGGLYNDGVDVPKDYAQSYYWLSMAVVNGANMQNARDMVETKLPPEVVLSIQQQVRTNFGASPDPLATNAPVHVPVPAPLPPPMPPATNY